MSSQVPRFAASLVDKVALITGASSGIGAATAILFSQIGAKLCLTGRNEANLMKTAKACEEINPKNKPVVCLGDLTKEVDTQRIFEKAIDSYGKMDVLVNNAGILEMGSIENTSLEQYDRIMNTNIRCVYQLTMLAVPYLIKTKGSIVNVSSVNGIRVFPGLVAYNVSKAALDQFTRAVALDLAASQVRVNSVNPGVTVTELQKRGTGMDEEAYSKFLMRTKETHALGRPGQPEEAARAIAFLASSDSSFITGASLPVDGGRHAMCPR
ncbi:3-oxoacyl-[acyl-carrier-protein] reductase FabG-like [Lineus longissimus]|uniref:3-oxoacyl-[acyl-carrier-protein] reductase FabG-like n=1 Tax=Lineus longissimus TaxID=88925 RepID=UPI002B4F60F1